VAVAVINPDEGLYAVPLNTTGFGVPKLVRFRKLKTSARNCSETPSEIAAFLNAETSTSANPGPWNTPLPKFPYVPAGGSVKTFGLNHWFGLPSTTVTRKRRIQVGTVGIARVSVTGTILAQRRREGEPAEQSGDSVQLPATRQFLCQP
jgi:hypothetical protein